MMKVSILVPVYGVEKFIEKCACSLLEQTYENIEYIFVDDCSPDKSVEIIKKVIKQYDRDNVTIIRHETNKGVGATRRTALLSATGDYILYVDSDDYLEKDAVSKLVDEAMRTGADVVRLNFYTEWARTRKPYYGQWSENSHEYTRLLLNASTMPGLVLHLIKKSLFIDNDLLPIEGINMGDDFVLTPRLCYHANKIAQIKEPLYHYLQTNSSSYTTVFNRKKVEDLKNVSMILHDYFEKDEALVRALSDGMWQKKVEMMLGCDSQYYPLVDELPTYFPLSVKSMNIQQKLAAPMAAHKMWKMLKLYSSLYRFAFRILQQLKGR